MITGGIEHGSAADNADLRYLDNGQLVQVLADYPAMPKPVSILYPSRNYLAPKVRVFIDWLTELLDQQDPTDADC